MNWLLGSDVSTSLLVVNFSPIVSFDNRGRIVPGFQESREVACAWQGAWEWALAHVTRASWSAALPPRPAPPAAVTRCSLARGYLCAPAEKPASQRRATLEEDHLATARVWADSLNQCRQWLASEECASACVTQPTSAQLPPNHRISHKLNQRSQTRVLRCGKLQLERHRVCLFPPPD